MNSDKYERRQCLKPRKDDLFLMTFIVSCAVISNHNNGVGKVLVIYPPYRFSDRTKDLLGHLIFVFSCSPVIFHSQIGLLCPCLPGYNRENPMSIHHFKLHYHPVTLSNGFCL